MCSVPLVNFASAVASLTATPADSEPSVRNHNHIEHTDSLLRWVHSPPPKPKIARLTSAPSLPSPHRAGVLAHAGPQLRRITTRVDCRRGELNYAAARRASERRSIVSSGRWVTSSHVTWTIAPARGLDRGDAATVALPLQTIAVPFEAVALADRVAATARRNRLGIRRPANCTIGAGSELAAHEARELHLEARLVGRASACAITVRIAARTRAPG